MTLNNGVILVSNLESERLELSQQLPEGPSKEVMWVRLHSPPNVERIKISTERQMQALVGTCLLLLFL